MVASDPGSHPAFRHSAFRTASDEKLDESLGSRLEEWRGERWKYTSSEF